ncbi:FG-GAP-like repeat-containing protein [Rhodopirellula sp. MGV]|uniref:FG-GAP-like repeat-containing protein n=1 Tax=Rhodopirellula sp. MGV TaxID=2023130 RepID=UPI0013040345|nr:FG-GAP-like repeat-containing protein [Rhodopirellula sp. MGV]
MSENDGVSFGQLRIGQLDAFATIEVVGGPAKLDAWIDFNNDGVLSGQSEQIADSLEVAEGLNLLQFDVPPTAVSGLVQSRFRISTAGNLGVAGPSPDGEVEDYSVQILPNVVSSGVFSAIKNISLESDNPRSVFPADLDADGDMDLVGASDHDDTLAWYENDGDQIFARHAIDETLDAAWDAVVADIDGDGDLDIVSASRGDATIAWFENDGNQEFVKHVISTSVSNALTVTTADLDGDGDLDIVAGGREANTIFLFLNDGNQVFSESIASSEASGVETVKVVDLDRDGDLDLLASLVFSNSLVWLENDGNLNFSTHTVDSATPGASFITAVDLDADGDLDVLGTGSFGNELRWFENDGNQTFLAHLIDGSTGNLTTSIPFDIDGDGDLDIAVSSPREGGIAWYKNDGNQFFQRHEISVEPDFAWHIDATDLDSDGDLDLISTSLSDNRIAWFENFNFDFGNAPAPYPTKLDDNGARHIPIGPSLGPTRDDETDAKIGSDLDTDGVTAPISILGFETSESVNSLIIELSEPGIVEAWADFDRNGQFSGSNEQIVSSYPGEEGVNAISYKIPQNLAAGELVVRVRVSSDGGLAPVGLALDGEVEDYAFAVTIPHDLVIREDALQKQITLSVVESDLVVEYSNTELFRGPIAELDSFQIASSDRPTQLGVNYSSLQKVLGFIEQAGTQIFDSISLVGGGSATVSLSELLGRSLVQLSRLDLGTDNSLAIEIASSHFSSNDVNEKTKIEIGGETEDRIVFRDPSNWKLVATIQDNTLSRQVSTLDGKGEITLTPEWKPWQNPLEPSDVNGDGRVSPLDALMVINAIGRGSYLHTGTSQLVSPSTLAAWPNVYVDQNGDGQMSPIDALRVINQIARNETALAPQAATLHSNTPTIATSEEEQATNTLPGLPDKTNPTIPSADDGRCLETDAIDAVHATGTEFTVAENSLFQALLEGTGSEFPSLNF